jgi:WhiB family redox-sensing transcriptional regulator
MDFRHRAICRDEDPELFFPVGTGDPALKQIAEAKTVCRRCPVASECLAWALDSGQDAGVWGGMSEDERRALKRRNTRADRRRGATASAPRTVAEKRVARARDLLANGMTAVQVAAEVGVKPDTVRRWAREAAA